VLVDIKSPVRSHAIAVLPTVASLQALRRVSKPSAASKPWLAPAAGKDLLSYGNEAAERAGETILCDQG
jgi:hypothetical protein